MLGAGSGYAEYRAVPKLPSDLAADSVVPYKVPFTSSKFGRISAVGVRSEAVKHLFFTARAYPENRSIKLVEAAVYVVP